MSTPLNRLKAVSTLAKQLIAIVPPARVLAPMIRSLAKKIFVATAVLMLALAPIFLVLWVNPTDNARILSVPVSVGARASFSWSGHAQLVSYGDTEDIHSITVLGPIRPLIGTHASTDEITHSVRVTGASGKANRAIAGAYRHWVITRSLEILGTYVVVYFAIRRLSPRRWWMVQRLPARRQICPRLIPAICNGLILGLQHAGSVYSAPRGPGFGYQWRPVSHGPSVSRNTLRLVRLGACGLLVMSLAWATALSSAYAGSHHGLDHVHAVSDLFDYSKLRTAPGPVGPKVAGYQVAVIGDSRASLWGGQPTLDPQGYDEACNRSRDSLAAQIQLLDTELGWHALNLACPSASIAHGLLGSQYRSGQTIPPQVGLLKQLPDLKQVVVMIGPNDVSWSTLMGACILGGCAVRPVDDKVSSELADFHTAYSDLLDELHNLSTHPEVVVVGSYSLYHHWANCSDTQRGPGEVITTSEIDFMNASRDQLNGVLRDGAVSRKFKYITPYLTPLCDADMTGEGPEIQGMHSPYAMHPTPLGESRIAAQVVRVLSLPDTPKPSPSATPTGQTSPAEQAQAPVSAPTSSPSRPSG